MANDGDKIAAATLAAAMLRRLEPSGSVQEDARLRDNAIRFAGRLYRDMLTEIQSAVTAAPNPTAAPTPIDPEPG